MKKENNTVWSFEMDNVNEWAYANNLFTQEECKKIIDYGNTKFSENGVPKNLENFRDSKISWLYPCEEINWVYNKISSIVLDMNSKYFNFELYGFIEGFQFTKYEAPSGYYGMHMDKIFNGSVRKLSLTIQLSDPTEYSGGDLNLYLGGTNPVTIEKSQGYMAVFPSYILHEVKPVTEGTRYSLVAWLTGKNFK